MAAAITISELRKQLSSILSGADLNALSAKKVRKQLEDVFEVDLTSRKKEIDDLMMSIIKKEENGDSDNAGSNSESEHSDAKKQTSESSDYEAPPPKKRNSTAKKTQKSRKANSDSDEELDDEAYARKLQEEDKKSMRRAASRNVPSGKKKEPRKKNVKRDGTPKAETPYSRKCILSEALAEVVGAPQMARSDVVKKMWALAKERDLFDPNNRRFVICDDQFQRVFGSKRVLMFGMMKYLKTHITDPLKKEKAECD